VGIIHRIVLVPSGGYIAERPRIDKLAAPVGSLEYLTVSLASIDAAGTETA
jgi:hypothetical protein